MIKFFLKTRGNLNLSLFVTILPLVLVLVQAPDSYSKDIIVFKTSSIPEVDQILDGFKEACSNGINIIENDMKGSFRKGEKIIKKIKKSIKTNPPKVILTIGDPATKLAQQAITEIPILFTMVINPEKKGFVGKNISGISMDVPVALQFSKLKTILTTIKTIGIIYDPNNTDNIIKDAEQAASDLGLGLVLLKVSSHKDVPSSVRSILKKVDVIMFIPDITVINRYSFKFIITTTLENKIPTMVYSEFLVQAGLLFSLVPDYFSLGQQAGNLVCMSGQISSQILPSIKSPEVVKLVINLKTAKRIGIKIPLNIIKSAKEVYQ